MAASSLEKNVCQLLMSQGVIEDDFLRLQIAALTQLPAQFNTAELFSCINKNLRELSFEIKSMFVINAIGKKVLVHGLVNTEDDFVAKLHGAQTIIFTIGEYI